jgi:hypothetical protein
VWRRCSRPPDYGADEDDDDGAGDDGGGDGELEWSLGVGDVGDVDDGPGLGPMTGAELLGVGDGFVLCEGLTDVLVPGLVVGSECTDTREWCVVF